PELALLFGGQRGRSRQLRISVEAEGKILERNGRPRTVNSVRHQLSNRPRELTAVLALEIREHDDLNAVRCCLMRRNRRLRSHQLHCEDENRQVAGHLRSDTNLLLGGGQTLAWKFSSTIKSFVPG